MKKILFTTSLVLLFSLFSCSEDDDNFATIKVINQTDKMNDFYEGLTSESNFIGQIGANQTETFKINIGLLDETHQYFYAEPINDESGEQFQVKLRSSEESTIIIE